MSEWQKSTGLFWLSLKLKHLYASVVFLYPLKHKSDITANTVKNVGFTQEWGKYCRQVRTVK